MAIGNLNLFLRYSHLLSDFLHLVSHLRSIPFTFQSALKTFRTKNNCCRRRQREDKHIHLNDSFLRPLELSLTAKASHSLICSSKPCKRCSSRFRSSPPQPETLTGTRRGMRKRKHTHNSIWMTRTVLEPPTTFF